MPLTRNAGTCLEIISRLPNSDSVVFLGISGSPLSLPVKHSSSLEGSSEKSLQRIPRSGMVISGVWGAEQYADAIPNRGVCRLGWSLGAYAPVLRPNWPIEPCRRRSPHRLPVLPSETTAGVSLHYRPKGTGSAARETARPHSETPVWKTAPTGTARSQEYRHAVDSSRNPIARMDRRCSERA